MPYALNLSGAWAKLERAKMHMDDLDAAVSQHGVNSKPITLRRKYEAEQGAIVVRIDSIEQAPDDWGLIVGDAVHNLRGALDHLAWELALRYFDGAEPTDRRVIKEIQFPVVVSESDWPGHINRKNMLAPDADKLKDFQPFNLGPINRSKGHLHPFEEFFGFSGVSNVDKHRRVHLAYIAPVVTSFAGLESYAFTDCVPVLENGRVIIEIGLGSPPSNPGDEVARVRIERVTGPSPDVGFEPRLDGCVAIRERWNVIEALDSVYQGVSDVLARFP